MKNSLLILFLTLVSITYSQTSTFSFNDKSVKVDAKMIIGAIDFTSDINKYAFDFEEFDKLAEFLKNNLTVKIEIVCNDDNGDNPMLSMLLTSDQADYIRNYLIKKGIRGTRIEIYGDGFMNPIVSAAEMKNLKGDALLSAKRKNRRVEIFILEK